jgi:hypothetical protein
MSTDTEDTGRIRGWLLGRLPEEWTATAATVTVDREEVTVRVVVPEPALAEGATDVEKAAAAAGRIRGWRESTREQRMRVADEAQHAFGRTVSWGARCGDREELFTHLAVPVMTRLRQPERTVLDTLVASGVARSRADALAWCVRLTGQHADEWLGRLREAMTEVERVRATGPDAG